jgi:hypothetical protein
MNLPILVRPEAQDDLLLARDWYEAQRPGLGDEFTVEFEKFLSRITVLPDLARRSSR